MSLIILPDNQHANYNNFAIHTFLPDQTLIGTEMLIGRESLVKAPTTYWTLKVVNEPETIGL